MSALPWEREQLELWWCWSCMAGIAGQNAATIVSLHFVGFQWCLEAAVRA